MRLPGSHGNIDAIFFYKHEASQKLNANKYKSGSFVKKLRVRVSLQRSVVFIAKQTFVLLTAPAGASCK